MAASYHIRIGPINEIVLEGFGEISERKAAEVQGPAGMSRAFVLEPVWRSKASARWDESRWREAVNEVIGRVYWDEPVEIRWNPEER